MSQYTSAPVSPLRSLEKSLLIALAIRAKHVEVAFKWHATQTRIELADDVTGVLTVAIFKEASDPNVFRCFFSSCEKHHFMNIFL